MRITEVRALHLSLPSIAVRADGTQDALLVKVETDAGITGIGEVDSSPLAAKGAIEAPVSHSIAAGLREIVLGEDPFEYEKNLAQDVPSLAVRGPALTVRARDERHRPRAVGHHGQSAQDAGLQALGRRVSQDGSSLREHAIRFLLDATGARAKWCVDQGFTAVKFG